jgi:protein-tyrosine phosphatase
MTVGSALLVVCTANVCRSPATGFLLGRALGPEITVLSAGLRTRPGEQACPVSAGEVGMDPGSHRAHQVTGDLVRQADLVLTFTRDQRSELIRLSPAAQRSCYTIGQAARTATWLLDQEQPALSGRRAGSRVSRPSAVSLAAELDSARGLVPRPPSPEDDDLTDPHGLGDDAHLEAFDRVHEWVDTLGQFWRSLHPLTVD